MTSRAGRPGRSRRALTRADVLVALALVTVTLGGFLVSLARSRELSRRAVCLGNMHSMETALQTYAYGKGGCWVAPHAEAVEEKVGQVDYTRAIGSYRGRAGDPAAGDTARMASPPTRLSTARHLWFLFRQGLITRDKFVCPSTRDRPNEEPNARDYWDFGVGDIMGPATPDQSRQGYSQVSYGYQVPFGMYGKPNMDWDKTAWLADKGPFGAAIEAGLPAPPPLPAIPPTNLDGWRPWNSPNHGGPGRGQGQVVMYGTVGSWFQPSPIGNLLEDNIYTQWSGDGTQSVHRAQGNPPTPGGRQTPAGAPPRGPLWEEMDALLYP